MALFKTEPSEVDWLQEYDMTHWYQIVLRTGASLMTNEINKYIGENSVVLVAIVSRLF